MLVQTIIIPALQLFTNDNLLIKTYNHRHFQLFEVKDDIVPHLIY